jgi:hypothetical protein
VAEIAFELTTVQREPFTKQQSFPANATLVGATARALFASHEQIGLAILGSEDQGPRSAVMIRDGGISAA